MKKINPSEIDPLLKKLEDQSLNEDDTSLIKSLIAGHDLLVDFAIKIIESTGPLRLKLINELAKILEVEIKKKASSKTKGAPPKPSDKKNNNSPSNKDDKESPLPDNFNSSFNTEKTQDELKDENNNEDDKEAAGKAEEEKEGDKKTHPQRSNNEYNPCQIHNHSCDDINVGDICPECFIGKIYPFREKIIPVIIGRSPLAFEEHRIPIYRCNACGKIFEPRLPEEIPKIGKAKSSALALATIMHYEMGVPFERISFLQKAFRQNLSPSQIWEISEDASEALNPIWEELKKQAANATVFYTDDTTGTILSLKAENKVNREKKPVNGKKNPEDRVAIYSSAIIGVLPCGSEVHLYFHGRKYAGENFSDILDFRDQKMKPPIQMKDALTMNIPGLFDVVETKCNSHALRKFKDIQDIFPTECSFILKQYRKVFENDKWTLDQKFTNQERLSYHKFHSKPLMEEIKDYVKKLTDERCVEPNSSLGGAIRYFLSHYEELIGFFKFEGAPLDNNKAERSLKLIIRLRKNSMFYKTEHGAEVAGILQSIIYTAEAYGENVFEYLEAVFDNQDLVNLSPKGWLPWTFRDSLANIENIINDNLAVI